jgi:hypothetical protein
MRDPACICKQIGSLSVTRDWHCLGAMIGAAIGVVSLGAVVGAISAWRGDRSRLISAWSPRANPTWRLASSRRRLGYGFSAFPESPHLRTAIRRGDWSHLGVDSTHTMPMIGICFASQQSVGRLTCLTLSKLALSRHGDWRHLGVAVRVIWARGSESSRRHCTLVLQA